MSFGQSQMPLLHFTKIGVSDTTRTPLKHHKMSKVGQNTLPEHGFWETLRMSLEEGTLQALNIFLNVHCNDPVGTLSGTQSGYGSLGYYLVGYNAMSNAWGMCFDTFGWQVDLYRGFTEEEYPSFRGNVYGGQLLGQVSDRNYPLLFACDLETSLHWLW